MKNEVKQRLSKKSHFRLFGMFFLLGVFLVSQLNAQAQERTINGTITGTDGIPLIGVSVVVKGTTLGSLTGTDGKFTLSIPASSQTLVFSFIGMETLEVPVTGEKVYNIVLFQSTVGLDEVIVIGYGTQKKSDLTGAVASVKMDELKGRSIVNVQQMLQGTVAGVSAISESGLPGGNLKINIRGIA